jgi:tRNA(Ile)-lysidine synthase
MRLVESPGADELAGRRIDAPGHSVDRVGSQLVLRARVEAPRGRAAAVDADAAHLFRYRLPVPGEVTLPETGCVVSAEPGPAGSGAEALRATAGNRAAAVVRRDAWAGPLEVRNRRPGDRFRPLGLDGQKKLQDFFVDRKVERQERDGVPLVVDGADRIVWVAGHGIDEAFRVTDASQAVVILKLRPA